MSADRIRSAVRRPLSPAVLVGLTLSLFGIPLLGELGLATRFGASTTEVYLVSDLTKWAVVGALVTLVVYWERRQLSSIGLEAPGGRHAVGALGAGIVGVVLGLFVTGLAVIGLGLEQPETLSTVSDLSLPSKVMLVITAAITEEIVWRGYPIERLTELTGRLWVGAGISGVVFLAVHFPAWGSLVQSRRRCLLWSSSGSTSGPGTSWLASSRTASSTLS